MSLFHIHWGSFAATRPLQQIDVDTELEMESLVLRPRFTSIGFDVYWCTIAQLWWIVISFDVLDALGPPHSICLH